MPQAGRECRSIPHGCEAVDGRERGGSGFVWLWTAPARGHGEWVESVRCWHMVRAMSIERPLREMVQRELQGRLGPLNKAIARMNARLDVLDELSELIRHLAPLAGRMQALSLSLPGAVPVGRAQGAAFAPAPARRAPTVEVVPAPRGRPLAPRPAPEPVAAGRQCAVIGCKRPARSKGYCSAHYQKLRLLVKTGRRPASWVDDAAPHSVPEVVLPRGRAAVMQRAETPRPPPPPAEPPKPKAWVRKKGEQDRIISLH